jgi:hypothetical protein
MVNCLALMRSLNPWPFFPSSLEPAVVRSLSIQFILQALLDGFYAVRDLQMTTPLQLQGANVKEEILCICKGLEKIYLFSMENPFVQKGSVLDKLCFYTEILVQASKIHDSELMVVLEEMRKVILDTKAKIAVWRKMPGRSSLPEMLQHLMHLYVDLYAKIVRFFKEFSPFLKEARSDENVLVYLIENKDKFNDYLGERVIENLLQSFFPAGHDQLRAAIHEGYTRRGFTSFLSSVEPLIEEIQWELTPLTH